MKILIDIATESFDGKRAVSFNGGISHHIREIELQEALKESNFNFWKNDITNGTGLGQQLYKFLNGSGGQLDSIIEESRQSAEQLSLYLKIPYDINSLPFELLYNGVFLAQQSHPRIYIIRKVIDRHGREKHTPEPRPLKVLFMACSPLDYRSHEVLEFEKEEDKILSGVERFPVDVITEDLGSLTGLYERLYEDGPFHVVHITGHAGHDYELGPVFYMEDDIGKLDKVTPERLWNEALRHFAPRLLFLSGCSTGKSDKVNSAESFAHCMVEKGVPLVLGWGLPVTDMGATRMTTKLYEYLGMGQGITEALANSRQDLEKNYHPWPLLRLFTDGSSLNGFISSGQRIRHAPVRKTRYRMLSEGHVKVLDKGFVGRRREIQKGVISLRGVPDEKGVLRYGILIRGPAGVGKSCLAGKLIERFKDSELIVFHGSLTSEGDILIKLKKLFDRLGETEGLEVIKSDRTYEEKIKELFRNVFQKLPLMIYFDDFEKNLVNQSDYWEIRPDVIRIIRPLLQALDWYETKARVMITSRYPFDLEHEGENLYEKLTDITLTSFKDADLRKKCAELSSISASEHKQMYLHYGCGNPRLLEWLEIIAENEKKYDPEFLAQALEGKNEDYIREYLAEFLMEIEGKEFSDFLRQASVFRRPVAQKAFGDIGDVNLLERGVGLTLFEKEHVAGQDAQYWVNPVIREKQWDKQKESEQKRLHQIALDWYDRIISGSDSSDYEYLEEAVYHALASDNIIPACRHSIDLGQYMNNLLLYEDKKNFQKKVADRITKKVIEEAISKKDDNIARLFNNLGITYYTLGESQKAMEYYEKALGVDLKVFGDKHPNVAIRYNNLGETYRVLGETQKAIEYYEKALGIDLKVFGDKHPNVATLYNNLGAVYSDLGEAQKAIEYYEKALGIFMVVYGEYHTYVATTNNNLGAIYSDLGEAQKAIEYYEKALGIFMVVYGEYHPYVAITNNSLGLAYSDLGEVQKAKEYYEKALNIDLKVFGDKHPKVAIRYNNLGLAYIDLGEVQKAKEYCEKAFVIDLKVFGDKHPNVARDYNNLGAAYSDLGEAQKAIEYYEKALGIDLRVFGDKHRNVARDYNNLGAAYNALREAQKAKEYYEKALIILSEVYGDDHPKTKFVRKNLKRIKDNKGKE